MTRLKRSKFDHTHVNSTTMKMGYIVPVMTAECLPGDTWQGNTQLFLRVAPMVAPLMHRVMITTSTIFVPIRLCWKNFQNFITGGPDGMDASVPPFINIAPSQGTLADYFGLPLTENELKVSALPFRAYALAYNWMWRDQDLQDELPVSLEDGEDTTTSVELMRGNWAKDYFTTSRPTPQKGPGITIPLVTGDGSPAFQLVQDGVLRLGLTTSARTDTADFGETVTGFGTYNGGLGFYNVATGPNTPPVPDGASDELRYLSSKHVMGGDSDTRYTRSSRALLYQSGIKINSADEIGIDINDLLEAQAMQRFATRRSLFGSRYEDLLHYWGLSTQDYRLQEPELVSVGRGRLQFSEVLQTSPDASGDGVGSMAGHGVGAMQSGRFRYYCHEHGFLITLLCVRPQAVYTQGLERMWTRETRWDYWNPEMQHIGQQEVLSQEVYADGTDADKTVFGYQNRFDEYRRGKNHVSGEFRTSMDYWNMARVFENRPSLNSEFINCEPTDRVFQLSESLSDQLYCMINNQLLAKRLLSRNGNPM